MQLRVALHIEEKNGEKTEAVPVLQVVSLGREENKGEIQERD